MLSMTAVCRPFNLSRPLLASTAFALSTLLLAGTTWAETPDAGSFRWHGSECPSLSELRAAVDDAWAATPAGDLFDDRGSGAPGYSVAVSRRGCGRFRYAVGVRDVTAGTAMTRHTPQHLGSLTKVLTAALVLRLDAAGSFGPNGLQTSVDRLLPPDDLANLTLGETPDQPLCPAQILTADRLTGEPRSVTADCPDFSRITLRHLLDGNHGLLDFLNEVDRDHNGVLDSDQIALGSLFEVLGIPALPLSPEIDSAFELLSTLGLLADPSATPGGTSLADFEPSFGNTGYTLLGVVAERVTGRPLGALLRSTVAAPLGLRLRLLTQPPNPRGPVAHQYLVTSGAAGVGLPEDLLGVYPQVEIAGHPAIDVYDLDSFVITQGAGGGGAAAMSPGDYLRFFEALVGGRLLEPSAQALFEGDFVRPDELPGVEHGFGVFRFVDPELGPGFAKSGRVTGAVCQLLHFVDLTTTAVVCRNSADAFLAGSLPPTATPAADLARELVRRAQGSRL